MNATEALNGLDIQSVRPIHSKFSPNLYAWLSDRRRPRRRTHSRVYRGADGVLWIGEIDQPDGGHAWFTGARLLGVLCNGSAEESFAHAGLASQLTEVVDFWQRYVADGRCAIDTTHTSYFVGDDARWSVNARGTRRTCLWCGKASQRLKRWTERVRRETWMDDAKDD